MSVDLPAPNFTINIRSESSSSSDSEMKSALDLVDCPICLTPIEEKLIETDCSHSFHEACLYTALKIHKICPLCRAPVLLEIPAGFQPIVRILNTTNRNLLFNAQHSLLPWITCSRIAMFIGMVILILGSSYRNRDCDADDENCQLVKNEGFYCIISGVVLLLGGITAHGVLSVKLRRSLDYSRV